MPLVKKISEAIEDLAAKRANVVVVLKFRDHELFVLNNSRSLTIAFREEHFENEFHWVYNELAKYIKAFSAGLAKALAEKEPQDAEAKRVAAPLGGAAPLGDAGAAAGQRGRGTRGVRLGRGLVPLAC